MRISLVFFLMVPTWHTFLRTNQVSPPWIHVTVMTWLKSHPILLKFRVVAACVIDCVRSLPEITLAVRCTSSWQPRRDIKLLLLLTTILLSSKAFNAANKPYDLVVHPADRKDIANAVLWWPYGASEPKVRTPNELDIDLEKTTVIYKMHGPLFRDTDKWDNFVITEE